MTTRCIAPGCGRFVYRNMLWCGECDPQTGAACRDYPPTCSPYRGVCCYVEAALFDLGLDPDGDVPLRRQWEKLHGHPAAAHDAEAAG